MMGIYAIVNTLTGRVYIGSSKNIKTRLRKHRVELRGGHHHTKHLQYAWSKYGEDVFDFMVLREVGDIDELVEIEQSELDARWPNVYNTARDTQCPNRGVRFSAKHRLAISKALTGKQRSKSHSDAISRANKGRIITPEWRANMAAAVRARPANHKEIDRIVALNKSRTGFKHSDDSKAKISRNRMGKNTAPKSEETRRRMSEAKKLYWAQKKASA